MYTPPAFRVADQGALHAFMTAHSFATLVTVGDGGLTATHLPLMLDPAQGAQGALYGHVARGNSQWRGFSGEAEALVIFQGAQAYISPTWYEAGCGGATVPTWNYTAVHAYGAPRLIEDPARVHALLDALTDRHEAAIADPWRLPGPHDGYIAGQMRGIVAFEIMITRLEGKFKLNQNRSTADQAGVVAALGESPDPAARAVAGLMAARLATEDDSG
jgi:transcriptional regulator